MLCRDRHMPVANARSAHHARGPGRALPPCVRSPKPRDEPTHYHRRALMPDIDVNMTLRPYDQFCSLHLGDAATPGVRLKIDHRSPLILQMPDGLDVAEVSFNRYVVGYAR